MKERKRIPIKIFLFAFTMLLFGAIVQLSLGEVGMQILGIQPIPTIAKSDQSSCRNCVSYSVTEITITNIDNNIYSPQSVHHENK